MRLRQVALAARALEPALRDLRRVLGLGEPFRDPGVSVFGLENAVLPLGDAFLEVLSPVKPDTTAGRWLDRRGGDAGYMAIFQTSDLAEARRRVARLGVRVVWETRLPGAATIHLHPRDLGGAIVSIDAMEPPESWEWAGPGWRERARSEVATGLVGVVLEAPEPEALAARWGAVIDARPEAAVDGSWTLALEQGTRVRFEPRPGAREPALVGVEIALRDPARFRAEARAAGVLEPDGAVRIAGTRFLPVGDGL